MSKLVLLDEQMQHRVRRMIPVHNIRTVDHQGWKGFKTGILLKLAEDAGFQLLLTCDQGIEHQQNLSGRKIAVVRLSSKNR